MKIKLILTALILSLSLFGIAGLNYSDENKLEQKALLKKKPIDKHLTTKNGCDVHIVGNVTFCCPMSFSGTITVGPPCQPVQYVFIVIVPTGGGDIEYGGGTSTQADFNVLFGDDPHLRQDFADYIIQEAE